MVVFGGFVAPWKRLRKCGTFFLCRIKARCSYFRSLLGWPKATVGLIILIGIV